MHLTAITRLAARRTSIETGGPSVHDSPICPRSPTKERRRELELRRREPSPALTLSESRLRMNAWDVHAADTEMKIYAELNATRAYYTLDPGPAPGCGWSLRSPARPAVLRSLVRRGHLPGPVSTLRTPVPVRSTVERPFPVRSRFFDKASV